MKRKNALISCKDGLALNGYHFITLYNQERSRQCCLSCGFLKRDVPVFLINAFRNISIPYIDSRLRYFKDAFAK